MLGKPEGNLAVTLLASRRRMGEEEGEEARALTILTTTLDVTTDGGGQTGVEG